jgi:hypothetical protein
VLGDALAALKGAPASRDAQEALFDAIVDQDQTRRVVLSNEYFLGIAQRAIGEQGLYPTAGRRASAIANLFPDAVNEFHLAIRNPATFIPALIARIPGATYASLMGETAPAALRWAPVIRRIAAQAPEARIVAWCNEDTPLLWPELLRGLAGIGPDIPLDGSNSLLREIMTPAGFERMTGFLAGRPDATTAERRKIEGAFLEKFGRPEEMEMELPVPGWTTALVEDLTAAYDADCDEIAGLARVEMLMP